MASPLETDWPYPYPLGGAQEGRADGRKLSPSKTGHEGGREGGEDEEDEEDMSLLAPTTFNKRAQGERQIVEIESC